MAIVLSEPRAQPASPTITVKVDDTIGTTGVRVTMVKSPDLLEKFGGSEAVPLGRRLYLCCTYKSWERLNLVVRNGRHIAILTSP
jgi:hypothetical protein